MRRLFFALLLSFSLLDTALPVRASAPPPGIVSSGSCTTVTDMQAPYIGTLPVNYHSRTRLPLFSHIPGGITPATIRLYGGVGDVQLSPAWIDYVERLNNRNAQIVKYLFHANSGWQNSSQYGRVNELVFEGQPVTVLRVSGNRAYLQTYFVDQLQPLMTGPSQLFTVVTRDDTLIGAPPGPARIILIARRGESLWIPANYLICGSRLPKSITVTAWPTLNIRTMPSLSGIRTGSLAWGNVAIVTETSIDAQNNVWGRTADGWIALLYNGIEMTNWQIEVTK